MNAPLAPDIIRRDAMAAKLRSLAIERAAPPVEAAGAPAQGHSRWLALGTLAAGLLLTPGLWALHARRPAAGPVPPMLAPAESGPAALQPATPAGGTVIGSGHVVARRRVVLRPEIQGRIVAVDIETGDHVVAGQRIARIDAGLAEADAALARSRAGTAEASVRVAEIELSDARHPLERLQALARRRFASVADLQAAGLRVERLEAALAVARQGLATARLEVGRAEAVLARHDVRAPFAGVIAARFAEVGDMVSPEADRGGGGEGVAVLLDPDALAVDVDVGETGIGRIAPGEPAAVTLDADPARPFAMRVATILPEATQEKGTVTVRLAFHPDPDGLPQSIRPGMAAKVAFGAASVPPATAKPASQQE